MAQAVLFIPDITGFTHFVTHTDHADHHRHIIEELLELIIDNNTLQLELAEIEGDALFYYQSNNIPSLERILQQIQRMFFRFHQHLLLYDTRRICQCGACTNATGLGLKFFVHLGEVEFVNIKGKKKIYGEEVIKIHRLMKNSVPLKEYVLITEEALDQWKTSIHNTSIFKEKILASGKEIYRESDIGTVHYQYFNLSPFANNLKIDKSTDYEQKVNSPLKMSFHIDAEASLITHLLTDLRYRTHWNKGIDNLTFDDKRINQVGEKHICIINNRNIEIETVKNDFGKGKWVYGEKLNVPLAKSVTIYYLIQPKPDHSTHLEVEVHVHTKKPFGFVVKPLVQLYMSKQLKSVLQNFKHFAEHYTPTNIIDPILIT